MNDYINKYLAFYQRGLNDAWDAARKIELMSIEESASIFSVDDCFVLNHITASEAIEKLKTWRQERDEIKVGDEVAFHYEDRPDTVIVVTRVASDGYIDGMDWKGTQFAEKNPKKWTKTGRHFPQVEELLNQMKEVNNGQVIAVEREIDE